MIMLLPIVMALGQAKPRAELLAAQNARSFLNGRIEYVIENLQPNHTQQEQGSFEFYGRNFLSSFVVHENGEMPLDDDPGMHTAMIDGQYVWTSGNSMLAVIRPNPPSGALKLIDPVDSAI